MSRVRAVILDVDGTLVDCHDPHAPAFVDVAEELQLPHSRFPRVRALIGMGGDKLIPAAFGIEAESGAADLVDASTSASDVGESKPDPDIVNAALRLADVPPGEAVVIADTPYDVEAAVKAGVRILAVRCGDWDNASLVGATAIYDDPADLLARYAASPLGDPPANAA